MRSMANLTSVELTAARMSINASNYKDLRRSWDTAENELQVVELELRHAITVQTMARQPKGIASAIWTLQIITAFAIVAPLFQMAVWGTFLSRGQRILVAGLFVSSIVIFFAYLAYEIQRIRRRDDEESVLSDKGP